MPCLAEQYGLFTVCPFNLNCFSGMKRCSSVLIEDMQKHIELYFYCLFFFLRHSCGTVIQLGENKNGSFSFFHFLTAILEIKILKFETQ